MLLPPDDTSFSRLRYISHLTDSVTRVTRGPLKGSYASTEKEYPYVSGKILITLDPKDTHWRWSQNLIKSSSHYDYLKKFDFGGSFITNSINYVPGPAYVTRKVTKIDYRTEVLDKTFGPTWPCLRMYTMFKNPIDVRNMPVGMDWTDLWMLGGSYVAQTMPTVPTMNMGVSLAEIIREGFPKAVGKQFAKKASAANVGSEYLNIIFGYGPIISDLVTLKAVLPKMEDTLKQLVRDSGRQVRRRTKPRSALVDSSYVHWTPPYVGNNRPGGSTLGYCHHTISHEIDTWFSAAYIYNLPSAIEVSDRFAQIRYVLGLNVDAQTMWNLIPWSWLIDWFVPIQPLLQNLSIMARNQVRIQRAYVMCHSRKTETARNGPYQAKLSMESKQRGRASPWGFGAKVPNLTGSQLRILAALGLSRGHI